MTIHLMILHYAKDDVTCNCIEALLDDPLLPNATITVIDNGSPTAFVNLYPNQVKVMRFSRNWFLIEAFNQCIRESPADTYFCITNDTKPDKGMVNRLVEVLADKSVGIVAPGTNDRGAGVLYVNYREALSNVAVAHVDNTCWGWRHDLIEAIGLPDCQGHTHRACWASNQDYCYRARMAGYQVVAVRDAYLWHAHDGGMDGEAWSAGRAWLKEKWGSRAAEVWAA